MEKGMDKGRLAEIPSVFSEKATIIPGPKVLRSGMLIEQPVRVSGTLIERPGEQSQAYEWTSRIKQEDKQSGSYERYTRKEKASSGERHVEKGQVGVKDEFTRSSTVRVGNKTGYTEHSIEERIRDINFGKSSSSSHYGPNKFLANDDSEDDYDYDNHYDYGSDDDY